MSRTRTEKFIQFYAWTGSICLVGGMALVNYHVCAADQALPIVLNSVAAVSFILLNRLLRLWPLVGANFFLLIAALGPVIRAISHLSLQ